MIRIFVLGLALLSLVACTEPTADLEAPVEPLGDFRMGHVQVAAPNLQKLLISRDVEAEVWTTKVDESFERRFGRFDGNHFYHFAISVEAYSLPLPFVPGKSALVLRISVWDDETASALAEEPELIYVIQVAERRVGKTVEQIVQNLTDEAARQTETWLREQQANEDWFGGLAANVRSAEVQATTLPDTVAESAAEPVAEPAAGGEAIATESDAGVPEAALPKAGDSVAEPETSEAVQP